MFFSSLRAPALPLSAFLLSLTGLTYSLFLSIGLDAGSDLLCLMSGCAVTRDFKIAGVSPWWGAALLFAVLAALSFVRLRGLAVLLAAIFLLGDCLFLLIMLFIGPCATCLLAAALIFLLWKSLRRKPAAPEEAPARWRRLPARVFGGVWGTLFLLNLGAAINELVPGQPLPGTNGENKKISLFFSPSCPACLEALHNFSSSAVLYPVAESAADAAFIAGLTEQLRAGIPLAMALEPLLAAQPKDVRPEDARPHPLETSLWFQAGLLRNQALAARLGGRTLPVILLHGLPVAWTAPNASPAASPPLPLDLGPTLECPRGTDKPCD